MLIKRFLVFISRMFAMALVGSSFAVASDEIDDLKDAARAQVGEMAKLTQVMVDKIFSFGELGFQEFETSRYLIDMLREHGFEVEEGIARHPDSVDGHLGLRQARHRLRERHRRYSELRKSRALPITTRSSKAHQATAKVTTRARL